MLAGVGQTDGVMEWGDLELHPQCTSTALQGMRTGVGDLQPLLAQWKGTGTGTRPEGKILLFGASEQRNAQGTALTLGETAAV